MIDPRFALGSGLYLLATPAFAEVSDKILSIPGMWLQAVLIGGIAILACRFRWWIGLPFMILPIVIALSTFGLKLDPELSPAIIEAHGEAYFHIFYASALFAAIMIAVGMWMGWQRNRHSAGADENN